MALIPPAGWEQREQRPKGMSGDWELPSLERGQLSLLKSTAGFFFMIRFRVGTERSFFS